MEVCPAHGYRSYRDTEVYSPMANLMLSVMGAFAEFERSLIRDANGKASLWRNNAAPIKDGKRPLLRNGRPSWSSVPATVFRKPSLPVATESAHAPRQAGVKRSCGWIASFWEEPQPSSLPSSKIGMLRADGGGEG
jgi:hypothetical protein